MLVVMVRIPVGSEDESTKIEDRFRNRSHLVDEQPGFISFELLKGNSELISVTRWESRAALDRWMASEANARAHGQPPKPTGGGHPHAGPTAGTAPSEKTPATGTAPGSVMVYEVVISAAE